MTLGFEIIWIVPASIILAIVLAVFLIWDALRRDSGTEAIVAVSDKIYEGAIAFLR
jgi:Na+/H+-translocating membrane pyrophosphatase